MQNLPVLVERATSTMSPPKKSGVETGVVAYLPAESLKVQLEREVYGLTGMGFSIDLHTIKGGANIKGRQVVDPQNPIKSLQVLYVHLPFLKDSPAAEALWDRLVENTFQGTIDYSKASHPSFKGLCQAESSVEASRARILTRSSPSN